MSTNTHDTEITFSKICPLWHAKFQEILNDPNEPSYNDLPLLGEYYSCVIGECIKHTKASFFVDKWGITLPKCPRCFTLSRNPIIDDIKRNRQKKAKVNIKIFYDEVVPMIESHFRQDHAFT